MGQRDPTLRRGWTTGTCAAGAAKSAFHALAAGDFLDPVPVTLPGGQTPSFALAKAERGPDWATAGIIKDAGDDPDVTHGALILATVRPGAPGTGVTFKAGEGVGTVTKPGLAIPPGEPAINPVPREMIRRAITEVAEKTGAAGDVAVEISVPGGEALAEKTMNARLGIVGGLSILGTTGIVVPYSCAAWIASIHQGIDVARAMGIEQVAGATGRTSEDAVRRLHCLPEEALIDMGDFVGGMLKYLRAHPVEKVTVAGGVAKISKLAQGLLDLHSKRGAVDLVALAAFAEAAGGTPALAERICAANTAAQAFTLATAEGVALGDVVARAAWQTAARVIESTDTMLEIAIFDREGKLVGHALFAPAHDASPRNRRR